MTLVDLLVILGLILVNALYVAAEFAAVSARRSRIRQLAEDGHRVAARLVPIIESPQELDHYIAACQVGITLASLVLGAYGQAAVATDLAPVVASVFDLQPVTARSAAAFVVLLSLTGLQMVLGELVPKSVALQYSTPIALWTYWPMRWTLVGLGWFIGFLNGSGFVILKLLRAPYSAHRHIHSPDEIELLLAESRDGGLLEPDEHRRLQRALRFSHRTARQLMIPRDEVIALDVSLPIDELFDRAVATPYVRFPVYEGTLDNVVGILNVKHLLLRRLKGRPVTNVREVLRPPLAVNEHLTGDRLIALLRERRMHQAIVQDAHSRLVGIVTLENLLSELLNPTAEPVIERAVPAPAPAR